MSELGDGIKNIAWAVTHPGKARELDKLRHAAQEGGMPNVPGLEGAEPWMADKSLREIDRALIERQTNNQTTVSEPVQTTFTPTPQAIK